jgi:hypothetical protein
MLTRDNALHCAGMVTKSPITRESPKETVKTIRVRECRVMPAQPW